MIKILGEIVDNQLPVVETNRLLLRQRKLEDAKEIF
ncbi:acetyltransferase, GNAT family [Streptococcus agalactiae]|nr:acetyltransferase, GNAT family [Streptococcus agalactiae]